MGCAVLAYGNTCVSCADLNGQVGVADGVSDLLKRATCGEHCKGGSKYGSSRCGNSRCHRHHVTLCDSAIVESFGELFLEYNCFCSLCQVCVKDYEIMLFAKLGKRRTVGFSCCFLVCHQILPSCASSSAIASLYSSSLGAFPCQPTLFSIKETPLPFVDFAIIAVGLPLHSFAALNAASI